MGGWRYVGECGCTFEVNVSDPVYDSGECKIGTFLVEWLSDIESEGGKRKSHEWFRVAMMIDLHFKDNCENYRSMFSTLN